MGLATPQRLHEALDAAFRAGDLDAVMALYERQAVFLSAADDWVVGFDAIRGATEQFLALRPDMQQGPPEILNTGDTAIIKTNWTLSATAPNGDAIEMTGKAVNVAHRGSDDGWLLIFRSILPSA